MVAYASVDVLPALEKLLKLDPRVYDCCGDAEHVYGGEVAASENARMTAAVENPTTAAVGLVMLQHAGGPPDMGFSRITKQRVDVRSYGATHHQAARLGLAVKDVLKQMHAVRMDGVLIYNAYPETGIQPFREPPPTDWPGVLQPFVVTYCEVSGEYPAQGV